MSTREWCPACGEPMVTDGICYAKGCHYAPVEARRAVAHLVDGYEWYEEHRARPPAPTCDGCGGALMYAGERCTCGRQPVHDPEAELAAMRDAAGDYEAELAADPVYRTVMASRPVDVNRELERRYGEWMAEARAYYGS